MACGGGAPKSRCPGNRTERGNRRRVVFSGHAGGRCSAGARTDGTAQSLDCSPAGPAARSPGFVGDGRNLAATGGARARNQRGCGSIAGFPGAADSQRTADRGDSEEMNMDPIDREREIEKWLDGALDQYRKVEPRAGLENRLLTNLSCERNRIALQRRWWWAAGTVPVTAAIVIAAGGGGSSGGRSAARTVETPTRPE